MDNGECENEIDLIIELIQAERILIAYAGDYPVGHPSLESFLAKRPEHLFLYIHAENFSFFSDYPRKGKRKETHCTPYV